MDTIISTITSKKRTKKKMMQITDVNKRFATFPNMKNMLIAEQKFLRTLMNSFAL